MTHKGVKDVTRALSKHVYANISEKKICPILSITICMFVGDTEERVLKLPSSMAIPRADLVNGFPLFREGYSNIP